VDQSGAETTIKPFMGMYILQLKGAICPKDYGCFIGGQPAVVVENVIPDNVQSSSSRLAYSVTLTTIKRVSGVMAAWLIAILGSLWRITLSSQLKIPAKQKP